MIFQKSHLLPLGNNDFGKLTVSLPPAAGADEIVDPPPLPPTLLNVFPYGKHLVGEVLPTHVAGETVPHLCLETKISFKKISQWFQLLLKTKKHHDHSPFPMYFAFSFFLEINILKCLRKKFKNKYSQDSAESPHLSMWHLCKRWGATSRGNRTSPCTLPGARDLRNYIWDTPFLVKGKCAQRNIGFYTLDESWKFFLLSSR